MKGTKTSLFLVELMLALLLFAFCAAVCVQIFYASSRRVREAEELSGAVFVATEAAELYKASGGDLEKMAKNYPKAHSIVSSGTLYVDYDENWNTTLNTMFRSSFPGSAGGYFLIVTEKGGGAANVTVRERGKVESFPAPGKQGELEFRLTREARDIFSIDVKAVNAGG